MSIRRILIANRGEIALRIIRTCDALGIETVLACSEADRDSLPARRATRSVCVGPARSSESYLKPDILVQAALGTGCAAIHPGYGFLSERADFARLCEQHRVIFIGPTADTLAVVGDKWRARAAAEAAGVPVLAGGAVNSRAEARELALRIDGPVLIKAIGGGGGRGMKLVTRKSDLDEALDLAAAEADAAFGDARVYVEQYLSPARHIEVQVLGDGAGHVVHLGERDCSVQRRYQKIIEETPAPWLRPSSAARLHEAAMRYAAQLRYRGAGTVEFLVEPLEERCYFLEMNARIQVEHPVTEAVTGVDLVAEQIAIADGRALGVSQEDVRFSGHAIECRVNAEDPALDFRPSPGVVREVVWPQGAGLRVDTHIENGASVPPYYDSLLGKIIAHGADRAGALERLRAALAATRIEGVTTNLDLHRSVTGSRAFEKGGVDTEFLAHHLAQSAAHPGALRHG